MYYYQEHNVDQAYKLIKQIEIRFTNRNLYANHHEIFKQIEREYIDIVNFSKVIAEPGW